MKSLTNNNFEKSDEEALYPPLDQKNPFTSFFTSISDSIKKANPNFL